MCSPYNSYIPFLQSLQRRENQIFLDICSLFFNIDKIFLFFYMGNTLNKDERTRQIKIYVLRSSIFTKPVFQTLHRWENQIYLVICTLFFNIDKACSFQTFQNWKNQIYLDICCLLLYINKPCSFQTLHRWENQIDLDICSLSFNAKRAAQVNLMFKQLK